MVFQLDSIVNLGISDKLIGGIDDSDDDGGAGGYGYDGGWVFKSVDLWRVVGSTGDSW